MWYNSRTIGLWGLYSESHEEVNNMNECDKEFAKIFPTEHDFNPERNLWRSAGITAYRQKLIGALGNDSVNSGDVFWLELLDAVQNHLIV